MSEPLTGDTVVYQNWLMKRSQMTRIFRRRFTLLTANGKLYSFRRADLSKPETLTPANASLVWDIRGCAVELAPKVGENTWVLKPTGPYLKEEICLRTCSSSPMSSCMHWMRVISAVSKHHLSVIYESVPTLTIEIELDSRVSLYAEVEGTLVSLRRVDPAANRYSGTVPVRSDDPGSCLVIKRFTPENGGEVAIAESEPIPRYRFHKSGTTLPWTVLRPQVLTLYYADNGSVAHTGSLTASVNEGLREYAKPLMSWPPESDTFDFSVFKFQIKRLIRIIDKIGPFKQNVSEIFEWKYPAISAIWLTYLTVVLLVLPGLIPALILLHVAFYSLSQSVSVTTWWDRSPIKELLFVQLRAIGYVPAPLTPITPPVGPKRPATRVSIGGSQGSSPPLTSASAIRSAVKDAAQSAIQQVQTAIANAQIARNPGSALKSEIWENQRRTLGGSQFTASNLSVFDRSRWSDESGKVALDPPSSSDWKIDVDANGSDDNGWTYNTRWGAGDWHPTFTSWDFVRRRRWVPAGGSSIASPPISVSVPPVDFAESEAVPSSLSGLVTSGPEYGNLQEDYDDANAEDQPKQAGLGSMFQEFKSTASRAQVEIADICANVERYLTLFSWRDELVSTVATAALLLGVIALVFIPVNVIVYCSVLSYFHLGYRRSKWRRVALECALKQHVHAVLPVGTDPSQLGGLEAHKVCLALSKRAGVNLTQKVLSDMNSDRDIAAWICSQSPAFGDVRKWMKRDWIENFIDHIPPEVSTEQQIFFSDSNPVRHSPINTSDSTPVPEESSSAELNIEPPSLISETL